VCVFEYVSVCARVCVFVSVLFVSVRVSVLVSVCVGVCVFECVCVKSSALTGVYTFTFSNKDLNTLQLHILHCLCVSRSLCARV